MFWQSESTSGCLNNKPKTSTLPFFAAIISGVSFKC